VVQRTISVRCSAVAASAEQPRSRCSTRPDTVDDQNQLANGHRGTYFLRRVEHLVKLGQPMPLLPQAPHLGPAGTSVAAPGDRP
jgi:hypothetical protein